MKSLYYNIGAFRNFRKDTDMEFTIRDRKVILKDNNNLITLSDSELSEINKAYAKATYYKEDVEMHIDTLIESGDLPEEASSNESFIEAVTAAYANNKEDYGDGTDENLPWTECLNMAFEDIDYGDFS